MRFLYRPSVFVSPGQDRAVGEDRRLPPDVRRKPWQYTPVLPAGAPGQAGMPVGHLLPPHIYPPAHSYQIHLPLDTTPVSIPAGGSAVLVAWPQVPQGAYGVVRHMGLTSSSFTDTRTTTRINLSPVQPYPGVVGALGEIEEPHTILVILKPGDVFSVLVENLSLVAAITAAVRTYGWWWY